MALERSPQRDTLLVQELVDATAVDERSAQAVEAVHASAYSVAQGPVAMEGRLTIDVTGRVELTASDAPER